MEPRDREQLLQVLRTRFDAHPERHIGLAWATVRAGLDANPDALQSLHEMEASGDEPDAAVELPPAPLARSSSRCSGFGFRARPIISPLVVGKAAGVIAVPGTEGPE